MRLGEWIANFKALHDKVRKGPVSEAERKVYLGARDELARALLGAQRATVTPGRSPRQALRVARALQADIELSGERVRAMTLDLCVGGFGCLVAARPRPDEVAKATLRLPGGAQVSASVRVVGIAPGEGNARVSFAFEGLSPADAETLEMLVFDTVLEQIKLEPAAAEPQRKTA